MIFEREVSEPRVLLYKTVRSTPVDGCASHSVDALGIRSMHLAFGRCTWHSVDALVTIRDWLWHRGIGTFTFITLATVSGLTVHDTSAMIDTAALHSVAILTNLRIAPVT